jgi:hypothetical protein
MSSTAVTVRCPVCGFDLPEEVRKAGASGPVFCPRPFCGVEVAVGAAERVRLRTFRLVSHSSCCVLPFSFLDEESGGPFDRLRDSGRWAERTFSLDNPQDVDRTEYFLPYVRRFLFPSLAGPAPASGGRRPAVPTCRHFTFDLGRLGKARPDGLPLTLYGRDSRKDLTFSHDLLLDKVELIVFSYRVGFLVLRVRCAEPDATYFDQMNSLVSLRTIAPLYHGFEMPQLVAGEARFRVPQLLSFLLAEFASGGGLPTSPAELPDKPPLPVKLVYDDRMIVYTFSCLDKETCLDDPKRCLALLDRATIINFDKETPPPPPREGDEPDARAWLRSRWEGFSKDGGSLVVFNTDRFHERFLGTYHGTYYFDIFLLAALQRVTLLTLFERLSDIQGLVTGSRASRRQLRRVWLDLLFFKNQCWFSQITNRERGLVLWKRWQEVFESRTLFQEVNQQSEELNDYLQNRTRERVERLVRLGGFLAAAVPAVLGLETLVGPHAWVAPVQWGLLVALILGAGLFAWLFVYRPRDEV